ncbi:MAG: tetratricopeptide repeat protein [Elusimicrobia bacterium]|nr:tetratricopeptide repeat protein [Elusimicrobiota bacterium]
MIFTRLQIGAFMAVLAGTAWRIYPNAYMQARMYRDQGDRSVAIALYKRYLREHPDDKAATLGLVAAYEAAGRPEDAIGPLESFYEHRRGDMDTGGDLIGLLERSGDFTKADDFRWRLIDDLRELPAAGRAGLDAVLYEALQRAVAAQDDERALRAMALLATLSNDGAAYRDQMVRLLLARGLLDRALAVLRGEERRDPRNADLRVTVARVLTAKGDRAGAFAEIADGLHALPYDPDLLGERAHMLMVDKQWTRAEPDLRTLLRIQPKEDAWQGDLATCLIESGRFDEGLAILDRRRELAPGDARKWWDVIYAYADHGRHAEAAARLETFVARFPSDPDGFDMLVHEDQQAGRPDLAITALERRVQSHPRDTERRKTLIQMLIDQERIPEALAQAKALLAEAPADPAAWMQTASLYHVLRDEKGAAALLERYHALYPDDADAMEELADIYNQLGETDKAISLLQAYFGADGGAR